MDDFERDAFQEGELAASNNEGPETCPYAVDSEDGMLWREGHDYVTGSDEDGEPAEDE